MYNNSLLKYKIEKMMREEAERKQEIERGKKVYKKAFDGLPVSFRARLIIAIYELDEVYTISGGEEILEITIAHQSLDTEGSDVSPEEFGVKKYNKVESVIQNFETWVKREKDNIIMMGDSKRREILKKAVEKLRIDLIRIRYVEDE